MATPSALSFPSDDRRGARPTATWHESREGLYRDTELLGYDVPLRDARHPGNVAGQDSVQAAVYGGRVFWLWGDTLRIDYPLGLFRMAEWRHSPKSWGSMFSAFR